MLRSTIFRKCLRPPVCKISAKAPRIARGAFFSTKSTLQWRKNMSYLMQQQNTTLSVACEGCMHTLQAEQDNQVQILNGTAAVSVFRFPFGESWSLEKSGKAGDPGSSLPKAQVRRPTNRAKPALRMTGSGVFCARKNGRGTLGGVPRFLFSGNKTGGRKT